MQARETAPPVEALLRRGDSGDWSSLEVERFSSASGTAAGRTLSAGAALPSRFECPKQRSHQHASSLACGGRGRDAACACPASREDQQDINPADNTATLTLSGPASQSTPAPTSGVAGAQAALQVRIVGQRIVGHRLVAATRLASGRLSYHWQACSTTRCTTITGATRSSLQVRPAWLGKRLRVSVVALEGGGRATAITSRIRSR